MTCDRKSAGQRVAKARVQKDRAISEYGDSAFEAAWSEYFNTVHSIRERARNCQCDACVEHRVMLAIEGKDDEGLIAEIYGNVE